MEFFLRLESLQATIVKSKEVDKVASVKVKDIEEKLSDAKGYRERELKAATDEMKRLKKKSEESKKNWKKREQVWIKDLDFIIEIGAIDFSYCVVYRPYFPCFRFFLSSYLQLTKIIFKIFRKYD